jgi:hypothetical protein
VSRARFSIDQPTRGAPGETTHAGAVRIREAHAGDHGGLLYWFESAAGYPFIKSIRIYEIMEG